MQTKLHTATIGGNLHDAAHAINKWGWSDYLVALDYGGGNTTAVFRMPAEMVHNLRETSPSWVGDVHFDDCLTMLGAPTEEPPAATKSTRGKTTKRKPKGEEAATQQQADTDVRQGIDHTAGQENTAENGQPDNGAYTQQQTEQFTDQQFAGQETKQQATVNDDLPDWARHS